MSCIVTFYSYKGGVGRSMALANIALLLARKGLRVLTVDWDLEAPGLERYFSHFEVKSTGPGLLRMCIEARDHGSVDFRDFTSSLDCETKYPLTLLSSGREHDEAYSQNLEAFDWEGFFNKNGGRFVESLREAWRGEFDIVLIDSRTGLSDTGGICTIQLPDIVVAMFTANYQSLYGVRDVMRLAQKARQSLAYDRMPLTVFPLPARWGVQEFQETQVWLDRVTEAVKELYDGWLPRTIPVRDVVERIKIPQIAFFSFGEKLAVLEQGTSDPQGMGFVYDQVASFLASDFEDLSALLGERAIREANAKTVEVSKQFNSAADPNKETGYLYDIYVSYDRSASEAALEFAEMLKQELGAIRGADPKIFLDLKEIQVGQVWDESVKTALLRSRLLLMIINPRYKPSWPSLREFVTFRNRATKTRKKLLAMVTFRASDLPVFSREFQVVLEIQGSRSIQKSPANRPAAWRNQIIFLAHRLDRMIKDAPPYDQGWKIATDTEVTKATISLGMTTGYKP